MGDSTDWTPQQVNERVPSVARMYDYFLGGAHNFAVDRELARQVLEVMPDAGYIARANRDFVVRAVRTLATEGYDQFVDIGAGLPGAGSVHSIVHQINPAATVVYVDNDPIVLAHGHEVTRNLERVAMVEGDARDIAGMFLDPVIRGLIQPGRPVVVVLAAVLHFMADDEQPAQTVAEIRQEMCPGSVLVFSHGTGRPDDAPLAAVRDLYDHTDHHAVPRSPDGIQALLAGFDMRPPGLTWVPRWYPDLGIRSVVDDGSRTRMLGVVADVA